MKKITNSIAVITFKHHRSGIYVCGSLDTQMLFSSRNKVLKKKEEVCIIYAP